MLITTLEESLINWSEYSTKNNFHQGTFGNRVKEFKIWQKLIPQLSLYKESEKELLLDSNSIYIQLKVMYAALILIIDDIVDNSTIKENVDLMLHLTAISDFEIPFRRSSFDNTLTGLTLCQNIITKAKIDFCDNISLFEDSLVEFVKSVNEEVSVINKILNGQRVSFEDRVDACGLQGSAISCFLDSKRIYKAHNSVDNLAMWNTSCGIGSYLNIKNSQRTVESEILKGEITSPLFVLACEQEDVLPIHKLKNLIWYQSISNSSQFKQKLEEFQLNCIKRIQRSFAANRLDLPRFMTAVGLLDNAR